MESLAKVVWSEGMLLRPQHFQQQDKFLYQVANQRHSLANPYSYGVTELVFDKQALALGQLHIIRMAGILPDGMPFEFSQNPALSLMIPADCRDERIYLSVPLEKIRGVNVGSSGDHSGARFIMEDVAIPDETLAEGLEEDLSLARLNPGLQLERDDPVGQVRLPILRVSEVHDQQRVVLDSTYIPPCLDIAISPSLSTFVRELLAMIKQRADALAARMHKANAQSSTLLDILMLQTLNRWQPLLEHYQQVQGLHPRAVYEALAMLAGELATFVRAERRVTRLPRYEHENLTLTFGDLAAILSQALSTVLEQTAIAMPLEDARFGIRVSPLADKSLLQQCQIILAVKADLATEEVRRRFPAQSKLGAVEHIRDLVNNHLPGIALNALPVAPRQIPYHAGYHYFMLDDRGERWQQLQQSGGLAIHVSGDYPGLQLELWAIRS